MYAGQIAITHDQLERFANAQHRREVLRFSTKAIGRAET